MNVETQIIRIRPKYDNSTKEFEVLYKHYVFDKYTRKLDKEYPWRHYRYYKTLQSAKDAIRDFRNSISDKLHRDYPAMGNVENEKKYPHIKPVINIKRYKIIRRIFQ